MNQPDQEEYRDPPSSPQWERPRPPAARPYVTFTILGITVLVYVLQELSGILFSGVDVPAALGMKVNSLIVRGEYWRLITPVLLHGSILHIGFNMYALYIFGPGLERHFGRWRFLTLYLLSGFAGNVFSFTFSPANSLGSSTAIFGLIAAEGVFLYQNRDIFSGIARQALTQIATIAGINLLIGMSPGIDNWGHIGGLVGGLMFSWLAGPLLYVEGASPYLKVRDRREARSVILAALSVALFFVVLAGYTISSRLG
jgi:rhomboid protease GluP